MMYIKEHFWMVVLLIAMAFPAISLGTIVDKKSSEKLFDETALVFSGYAEEVDPNAYDASIGLPFTRVRFSVDEVLFGEYLKDEIEFLLPGGNEPEGSFFVSGAPKFERGEYYLLFIQKGDWLFTPIANWRHGVAKEVEVNGEYFFADTDGNIIKDFYSSGFETGGHRVTTKALLGDERPVNSRASKRSGMTDKIGRGKAQSMGETSTESLEDHLRSDEILDNVAWASEELEADPSPIRTQPKRLQYNIITGSAE